MAAPGTHFFAAVEKDGHVVGCATLCVINYIDKSMYKVNSGQ